MVTGNINSNNDIRPLAARILRWQMGLALAVAMIAGLGWGRRAGLSALAGGAIGVIANLYMTLKALKPAVTPAGALGRLYMGQLVKVAITVGLFVAAARVRGLSWPALLIAYLGTLVAFWWVPFRAGSSSGGK
jgi:F0F1-type ATP synthase assembly protein I